MEKVCFDFSIVRKYTVSITVGYIFIRCVCLFAQFKRDANGIHIHYVNILFIENFPIFIQ